MNLNDPTECVKQPTITDTYNRDIEQLKQHAEDVLISIKKKRDLYFNSEPCTSPGETPKLTSNCFFENLRSAISDINSTLIGIEKIIDMF